MDSCKSTLFTPVLFNFRTAPEADAINHVVGIAVPDFHARLLRGRAGVIVLHSEACRSIKTNLFIETDSRLNRSRRAAVSAR